MILIRKQDAFDCLDGLPDKWGMISEIKKRLNSVFVVDAIPVQTIQLHRKYIEKEIRFIDCLHTKSEDNKSRLKTLKHTYNILTSIIEESENDVTDKE